MINQSLFCYIICGFFLCCSIGLSQGKSVFHRWDKNGDGHLVREEVPEPARKFFDRKDADGDGKITLAEHLGEKSRSTKAEFAKQKAPSFYINQRWSQEAPGFDRPVYVYSPPTSEKKVPVIIAFHGNGGAADRQLTSWAGYFPNHLIVAPQGYLKSWNVQGERSRAPDVEFFKLLVKEILERHPEADANNLALLGTSNGAGMIYRLMIEVEQPLFHKAVPMVSSLLETQYHDGSFWKPSKGTDNYDTKTTPAGRIKILYIHGTDDQVVPYGGGRRSGKFKHRSAMETANTWAEHQGYTASEKAKQPNGVEVEEGLTRYDYPDTDVTHIAVNGGNHGLNPYRETVMQLVVNFIGHR